MNFQLRRELSFVMSKYNLKKIIFFKTVQDKLFVPRL